MFNPLVSVIITTYSRPENLRRAIISVLNQTYRNIELIVVDDNDISSEYRTQTSKVIEGFSDRVKYIQHQTNCGANVARNTGIDNSKGEYICFLDDDDEYLPRKIEEQINVIDIYNRKTKVLVFVGANIFGNTLFNNSLWMKAYKESIVKFNKEEIFASNYIGSNSFIMVDKLSLMDSNKYDINMPSCQDWDLYIRLSLINVDFFGINKPLVNYYHNDDAIRITNNKSKRIRGHELIKEKYEKHILEKSNIIISRFYRYLYYQYLLVERQKAIELLPLIKKYSFGFRQKTLANIDVIMLNIVRFKKLYDLIRIIKNRF
ncbi:MAG: glycosyltransferase family 2 protein [bacterium]